MDDDEFKKTIMVVAFFMMLLLFMGAVIGSAITLMLTGTGGHAL